MFVILTLSLLLGLFVFLNCFSYLFSKNILINFIIDSILCLFFFSFFVFLFNFIYNVQYEIEYVFWINIFLLKIKWSFFCDNFISLMLFVVCLIAGFVVLFSIDYLYTDPFLVKFLSYLFLFTFFMIILITGQHFLHLFLGWEGVGLCSYLLISFWSTRQNANKSALKALIINRIGDIFLLFAFGYIYFYFRSLDFSLLFLLIPYFQFYYFYFFSYQINLISLICFFLLVGAIGKSAQFGLHTWLPDAMEGPTPVSALIHAATMVTAGVFLIIKCSFFFEFSNSILLLITFIGGLTAIFASTIGVMQYDLKKVIAYSTCSQLGLMFFICGLSCYTIGFFHLLTHACFKALLFLVAGAIIHQVQDEQDIRKFGGLFQLLPFLYTILIIGSCALMGFPFLAGFYSKDLIIESILFFDYEFNLFFKGMILIITLFTCIYSMRLIYKSFFWFPNGFKKTFITFHKISFFIFFVLFFLACFSILFGFVFSEIFSISGSLYFSNNIYFFFKHNYLLENEFLPYYIKLIPLLLSCSLCFIYILINEWAFSAQILKLQVIYFMNQRNFSTFSSLYLVHKFLLKKWFFDALQNKIFAFSFLFLSYQIFFLHLDKGFLEIFGPFGINKIVTKFSFGLLKGHSNFFDLYFIGVFSLFIFLQYIW
jgi:proton-translocating NADH-quinone oxidoreductase chain L